MKKFLRTALALLPLAVMASCAADDPIIDDSDGIAKSTETRYLQVSLKSADGALGTRGPGSLEATGSYANGTTEENKINTLEFYFYDRFKNFHSYYSLPIDKAAGDENGDGTLDPELKPTGMPDNVDVVFHCNVPIELVQGETLPSYVICIVNSVEGSAYKDKTMAEAQTKMLTSIYGSDTEHPNTYFGMSNSVYYGRDEATGEDNQLIMATPFDSNKLLTKTELDKLTTDEEKKKATVEIFVERYAAKVNLDLSSTTYTDYPTTGSSSVSNQSADVISLKFTPKKWIVNAVEKQFFFLKAFRTMAAKPIVTPTPQGQESGNVGTGYTNDFETFATLDGYLFTGWNNPEAHRSFWARSPGYYANTYPVVADDVNNGGGADKNNTGQYSLAYYSYDQCKPLESLTPSIYTMETTMKQDRLTGGAGLAEQYLPTASIPAVLIVGQYSINGENKDFYIYGKDANGKSRIFSGDDPMQSITGTINIKDKMLYDQTVILSKNDDGSYSSVNQTSVGTLGVSNLFTVEHPSAAVRTTQVGTTTPEADPQGLRIAADVVVLQLTSTSDKLYFYNSSAGAYQLIDTEAKKNLANRLLLQNLGGAHYYKQGMAYFSAPIVHWGWYSNKDRVKTTTNESGETVTGETVKGNPNKDKPTNEWDWSWMRVGDFGIVRNHVYTMKIGKIEGLGTGIKDENEPIVPPADKVGYAVHFHVNIQKWAVLPVQTWNF